MRLSSPTAYALREAERAPQHPLRNAGFPGNRREADALARVDPQGAVSFPAGTGPFLPRPACRGSRFFGLLGRASHRGHHHAPNASRASGAEGRPPSPSRFVAARRFLEVAVYFHCAPAIARDAGHRVCGDPGQNRRSFLPPGENCVKLSLAVLDPELWWPAGHGASRLYELEVQFESDSGAVERQLGASVSARSSW